jgi:ABC-2 type transport system ATP-binding protein
VTAPALSILSWRTRSWVSSARLAFGVALGSEVLAPDGEHGLAVIGLDAPAIADLAAEQAIPVHELTPRHATLEQAYLDLTEASVDYPTGTAPGKELVAG